MSFNVFGESDNRESIAQLELSQLRIAGTEMNLIFGAHELGSTERTVGDFSADPFVAMAAALEGRVGIDVDSIPVFKDGVFEVAFGNTHGEGQLLDLVDHVAFAIELEGHSVLLNLLFFHRAGIAFDNTTLHANLGTGAFAAIIEGLFSDDGIDGHSPLCDYKIRLGGEFDSTFITLAD